MDGAREVDLGDRRLTRRRGVREICVTGGSFTVETDGSVHRSCLCGGVRFEVTLPFRRASHCHCSRCRKHPGTGLLTQGAAHARVSGFSKGGTDPRLPSARGHGQGLLRRVRLEPLRGTWPHGPEVSVHFGALDGDPGIRPQYRMFVGDKAPGTSYPKTASRGTGGEARRVTAVPRGTALLREVAAERARQRGARRIAQQALRRHSPPSRSTVAASCRG